MALPPIRVHARSRLGPLTLLLLGLVGVAAFLRNVAFLGASAPGIGRASAARSQLQISQQVPRSSSAALAARGGDDDEDDYEFAGGEVSVEMLKVGMKLDGVVVNIRDFGAFVDFGAETQGLVPLSKMADQRVENVEDHVKVGDSVPVWVSDLKNGRVTLSMTPNKIYGPNQGARADISLFEGVSDEEWTSGTVMRVMPFGAFVQVQAPASDLMAQGLVHVSQMGEERVEDPAAVVAVGDEVKVRVIQVDTAKNKLSFSMKEKKAGGGGGGAADLSGFSDVSDDEWLDGTVKGIVNFGAFVEVAPPSGGEPVQGLVHITQIRDGFVEDAGEEVEVDQAVKVRVISLDTTSGKINLSMKAKQAQEQAVEA